MKFNYQVKSELPQNGMSLNTRKQKKKKKIPYAVANLSFVTSSCTK